MTARAIASVMAGEWSKLRAQWKVQWALAICAVGPFAFVAAMRVQSNVPEDTLFGRAVTESGFATPLVVLGFAALWVLPVLTSLVGGDVFAAEDRYGTWPTILTRSCTRADVFAGKALTALEFSTVAIVLLGASSTAAGLMGVGVAPLVDLSGALLAPGPALRLIAVAWTSVLPSAWALTALAILVSVATRSSAAGIGVPIVGALTMQLVAFIDAPDFTRDALVTSGFVAWHGLANEHPYYGALLHAFIASGAYFALSLAVAYWLLRRRDISG